MDAHPEVGACQPKILSYHYPEKFEYSKTARSYLKSDYPMSGYQLMIRGELFRGRFRKGFDNSLPFKPEEITPVNYTLYDVAHTFLPGHRLMIQIQSSWFQFTQSFFLLFLTAIIIKKLNISL